jgi:excinuclease ABC subunit C
MQDKSTEFDTGQLGLFPASPGVYLMKNKTGKIIYIGKAKNLRNRIRTYFSKTGDGRLSVSFFLPRIKSIEVIITGNEKEAFLLENILIKKHKPQYNIRLKDDKTYISLRIDTKKKYPGLEWVRKRKKDGAMYFGPYSSSSAVRNTVRFLEKIFPLRSCTDSVMRNRCRPCIRKQIGRCLAPCVIPVEEKEYHALVNGVILYLRGNMKELKKRLSEKMLGFSNAMNFEKAAELRDRISAIDATVEKQAISDERCRDVDVIAHYSAEGQCCIVIFQYRMGVVSGTRSFTFSQQERSTGEIYYSFIAQYYGENTFIPGRIFVAVEPDEINLLEDWLSDIRGAFTRISVPQRGKMLKALQMVKDNSREEIKRKLEGERDLTLTLQALQGKLRLPEIPTHIEAFDISNIQGRLAVGSMVCFIDGKSDTSKYRKFKIQTVIGSDDFAMMYEVVKRRYTRLKKEKKPLPKLILIDGGKGQLNAALRALNEIGLEGISIIGLAKSRIKDDKKKPGKKYQTLERVFLPNRKNPVILRPGSPALFMIQRIRDEAHRFAITFHKKLRSKSQRISILDEIPGIGPSRKKELLKHFGSLSAIKKVSIEELSSVNGMNKKSAENVYYFFHPEKA